jgi:spermidine/putrescine transport system ATP-binding protein
VPGIQVGKTVHLSVRPERLRLSEQALEKNSLLATVVENIYVGTDVQSIVKLNDGPLMTVRPQNSKLGNSAVYVPGSKVYITMEAGAARLLQY